MKCLPLQWTLVSMTLLRRVTGFAPFHQRRVSRSVSGTLVVFAPVRTTPPRRRSSRTTTTTRSEQSSENLPDQKPSSLFSISWKDLPLHRRHEHSIFCLYATFGTSLLLLRKTKMLHPVLVESAFSLIWASMILSISFLEAWVKFQAPFLRKHVAVDVGRHVFCALNTAELAWSTSFGFCLWQRQNSLRAFPLVAMVALWVQILLVAPKLYTRAQHQIVQAMTGKETELQDYPDEQEALVDLTQQAQDKPMPDVRWHFVYVALEAVKLSSLLMFVFRLWSRISR